MRRPDLLALTDDALATVANRGLVKRALRDHQNAPPTLTMAEDSITAAFGDGVETVLRAGVAFTDATCTCVATAVCRHRIGLVLAVRAAHSGDVDRDTDWTPGEFDDDALVDYLGASVVARAKRLRECGYQATIHRSETSDPIVRVELPHCTVRFLVPHQLGHAHSSATDHTTGESIALAVWAVRVSDDSGRPRVHVGPNPGLRLADQGPLARSLARTVLLDGVAATSAVQVAAATRASAQLDVGSAVWLADACADLNDQMVAYLGRHARHDRVRVAQLIAEIHARAQLGDSHDSAVAAAALGTNTPGETPLRRARLVGLGAHVSGVGDAITSEVFFAETDSDAVFVVRHDWGGDPAEQPTGFGISGRRVFGTSVAALASSTVVTESAVRRANHQIRLARKGIGKTSVLPLSTDAWARATALVENYGTAHGRLSARTPSFARDRVATDGVAVLQIDEVVGTDYSPADQTLIVTVADALANTARILVEHRACTPGAIDATMRAVAAHPTAVTGRITVRAGMLQVSPFAIACDLGVVVPDLESGEGTNTLIRSASAAADPIDAALDGALGVLADLSHRGLRFASSGHAAAIRDRASALSSVGMHSSARTIEQVAATVGGDVDSSADAWVGAVARLMVASESR